MTQQPGPNLQSNSAALVRLQFDSATRFKGIFIGYAFGFICFRRPFHVATKAFCKHGQASRVRRTFPFREKSGFGERSLLGECRKAWHTWASCQGSANVPLPANPGFSECSPSWKVRRAFRGGAFGLICLGRPCREPVGIFPRLHLPRGS